MAIDKIDLNEKMTKNILQLQEEAKVHIEELNRIKNTATLICQAITNDRGLDGDWVLSDDCKTLTRLPDGGVNA